MSDLTMRPIIKMTGHNELCDVDPDTLQYKKDFKKGDTAYVCLDCIEKTKDYAPRHLFYNCEGKIIK